MTEKVEYACVTLAAYEMRKAREQQDSALENLNCLLAELLKECGQFWPVLTAYIRLLRLESALIRPWDAHEAGKRCRQTGDRMAHGMIAYLSQIENTPTTQALRAHIQTGFELLIKLSGKRGLASEFVSEYMRLYGSSTSLNFFEYGYNIDHAW